MSYRDDRDADRARIEALEAELAAARDRIDELEGRRGQALVLASQGALARTGQDRSAAQRWLGAPLELALTRELPGAFPTDRFEDVIERIRSHTRDPGRSELLRSSLTWSATSNPKATGPFTTVTVTVRDGVTKLVVTDKLGQLAGALYGGIGGGLGGGGIVAPLMASIALPLLTPLFMGAWFGGVYAGTRALFKRVSRRRAEQLQRLFDALVDELDRGIATSRGG